MISITRSYWSFNRFFDSICRYYYSFLVEWIKFLLILKPYQSKSITEWISLNSAWNNNYFFLERQFIKGAHYQLLIVAALTGLMSIIGGILVLPTGEPLDDLGESVWWAFLRLSDLGYLGDYEGAWRRIISTIITFAGYVVFLGALVAIITT